ncbi:MAG: zinc-dependent metalloprotease [Bacteroidota bacterium]
MFLPTTRKNLLLILFLVCTLSLLSQKAPKDSTKAATKKGLKALEDFLDENTTSDEGLFTVYKKGSDYFFEIPDSLLEREILVISRIAGTIEGFNFGGAGMKARGQQVWRWQKKDEKLLLRSVSFDNVADEDQPIYQSVRNNNFEPIIMTFKQEAWGKDSAAYIIKVNELFESDVAMIGPLRASQRRTFKVKGLDKKRSLINYMKSFPLNTEVRHILTYRADEPPSNRLTNTLSIEMNQSMILLPKEPMMPRVYDPRVGFFSVQQTDYGRDAQKAERRRYITRWRLEPKDPEAFARGELVEPKKPIVYYIDPATPERWRKYIKQGVDDWEIAFREAGFKNAIRGEYPPSSEEDPDWSPEDVRYSVIRYTANPIQNAQGPHVHDPRSGEIIESDIIWYHNVMNLLRNWFFIQTAAVNPDARKVKFKDEIMGELIRFVSAHEVGHTLGFPHNMGSSFAYPTDSMRSPSFTKRMGTAPSIMDYARFNYIAQPGDNAALYPKIGVYDKWSVKWGYTPIPNAQTPDEEKETLHNWIREHEGDLLYWYGPQTFNPIDPRSQTEDLSNDAIKASTYGVENLKRIVPNLIEWTEEIGKGYDDLEELYGQVVSQWGRYQGHVKSNIGGIYETRKTYDQDGVVYERVPKPRQQEAMGWLQREVFSTPQWLIEEDVLARIEGTGSMERIRRFQTRTLSQLLDFGRLARLIEGEAMQGRQTYTTLNMLNDLRRGIWSELSTRSTVDPFRRNLQRAYVERMEYLMTQEQNLPSNSFISQFYTRVDVSQSDIRPLVRGQLKTLLKDVQKAAKVNSDEVTKYHLEDVAMRIAMVLGEKK